MKFCRLPVAVLIATGTFAAQEPVFKSGVDLVSVDVTVLSKDGQPVAGLKPADFVVKLSGERCAVRFLAHFDGDRLVQNASDRASELTATVATAKSSQEKLTRTLFFLLDDLSVRPGGIKELTDAAGRLIEDTSFADLVGMATVSGRTPPITPTLDRSMIRAALHGAAMSGDFDNSLAGLYIGVNEAMDIEADAPRETLSQVSQRECAIADSGWHGPGRSSTPPIDEQCVRRVQTVSRMLAVQARNATDSQVAALRRMILALRAAPQPRVLILLTAGLALHPRHGMREQIDQVARAAAEAEVQLYSLTQVADGLELSDRIVGRSAARRAENKFLTEGIQTLAAAAGGEAFRVIGQPDRFLRRVLLETSEFYRLGVDSPNGGPKGATLNVEVSVTKRDTKVLTRRHVIK